MLYARDHRRMTDTVFDLASYPAHLDRAGGVARLPEFDGSPDWYERYSVAHADDGDAGRLVSLHSFTESWDSWEMHPRGEELVVCVAGAIVLHQEIGGDDRTVELGAGDAVINPAGVWHTADVTGPCTALFITAGAGTEVRSR
jgi:mannose-6-phosphate isomerase-like protein (cupin superfamily)